MTALDSNTDDMRESLLGDFLDESGQLLDRLNENLLLLDHGLQSLDGCDRAPCNPEILNEMFRSAHSLKGLSAMLGLSDINQLTHKIENVFDAARKGDLLIDAPLVELMFRGVDRLGALVLALQQPEAESVECETVIESIRQVLQTAGVERQQGNQAELEKSLAAAQAAPAASATETPAVTSAPESPAMIPPPTITTSADIGCREAEEELDSADKYLSLFVDETEQSLDSLTETLLNTEGHGQPDTLVRLMTVAHRIKGSAAAIGLSDAARLAHAMEDALQELINTSAILSPEMTDRMLQCIDGLRQYLSDLKQTGRGQADLAALQAALFPPASSTPSAAGPTVSGVGREAAPAVGSSAGPGGAARLAPELLERIAAAAPKDQAVLAGQIRFQPGLPLVGLKAHLLLEKLARHGELCYVFPPQETLDDVEQLEYLQFGLISDVACQAIPEELRIAGVEEVRIEPLPQAGEPGKSTPAKAASSSPDAASSPDVAEEPKSAAAASAPRPCDGKARAGETLRVDTERLDHLMNLAGQLVISRARFSQIGDRLRGAAANKHAVRTLDRSLNALARMAEGQEGDDLLHLRQELRSLRGQARTLQTELGYVRREMTAVAGLGSTVSDLVEAVHQLELVSNGIQQSVMEIRMVPIGPLFTRFKRVIRDITRANGKDVQLVIKGEKTELDKRMIDELSDPLIHMVRNAADHGVEAVKVREAAGKPRQGTVTLNAFHRGNHIVIQVSDDGQGLDEQRIRRKCVEKGFLGAADAEKMTPQQIYQMIWEPGLSTAEKVTEVSGRGMGMDIVKSKIERLSGAVEVESLPGRGTTFTIRLPLTMAILPSLMVEIAGDVFALPMESVVEIVRAGGDRLASVHGRQMARVRQRVIAVARLEDLFGWSRSNGAAAVEAGEAMTLVIVGERQREMGLAVDRVLGEEDVVIKSMAENYRNVAGIAGASILGDGRVSLIVDIGAVLDMASRDLPAEATV